MQNCPKVIRSFRFRFGLSLALTAALAGCIDPQVGVRRTNGTTSVNRAATTVNAGEYRVKKGETLYAIAFKYALDYRELASWNGIAEPFTIFPNQRLRLRNPTAEPVLEASAPRPSAPVAPSITAISDSSVAVTSRTESAASPPVAPADGSIAAGQSVPASSSVVVGALGDGATPLAATAEPLSPANAQGLPTGFTEARPTSALATPPASAAPVAAAVATEPPQVVASIAPPAAPEIIAPSPVATASAATPIAARNGWGWPVQGKLISTFSSSDAARQGIDIVGAFGDAVHAAKAGEVVYSGRGIIGYGELIVIKHDDATLTAYGHNRKRLVKEGQRVAQGQPVAEMGKDPQGRALLHFELRRNGKPVDPLGVLPAR